jgi:hypothetical protein
MHLVKLIIIVKLINQTIHVSFKPLTFSQNDKLTNLNFLNNHDL